MTGGIGLSYSGLPACVAWWAGTTTPYAGVNFIPPVRDNELGYRIQIAFQFSIHLCGTERGVRDRGCVRGRGNSPSPGKI
jgi:hypothetical protein